MKENTFQWSRQTVNARHYSICNNEHVFKFLCSNDIKWPYQLDSCHLQKNAMQQPAIFPALVVTTRLITYLNCRAPAVTSTMISYLEQLHSQKRSFPPKRMLKQPNVTQQWKALPWTTTLSVPNGIAFCCDSWITFVRVLDTRTRSIHIDEPNQKQLSVPKPKRTMQEQNDVSNILS